MEFGILHVVAIKKEKMRTRRRFNPQGFNSWELKQGVMRWKNSMLAPWISFNPIIPKSD